MKRTLGIEAAVNHSWDRWLRDCPVGARGRAFPQYLIERQFDLKDGRGLGRHLERRHRTNIIRCEPAIFVGGAQVK
jgi:hypothetical protein